MKFEKFLVRKAKPSDAYWITYVNAHTRYTTYKWLIPEKLLQTRIDSIDEKTEKEKRSSVNYLVQATTLNNCIKNIEEVMGGTMIDYVIDTLKETKYMDVFEYVAKSEEYETK